LPVLAGAQPDQRNRPAATVGNFAEAARELALSAFQELAGSVTANSPPPAYAIRGERGERRSWQRRIGRLWSFASGDSESVSASRLRGLHVELLELRAATSAGVVQFTPVS
jgi:hypothetical protein